MVLEDDLPDIFQHPVFKFFALVLAYRFTIVRLSFFLEIALRYDPTVSSSFRVKTKIVSRKEQCRPSCSRLDRMYLFSFPLSQVNPNFLRISLRPFICVAFII